MHCSRKLTPVILGLTVTLASAMAAETGADTAGSHAAAAPEVASGPKKSKPKAVRKDAATGGREKPDGEGGKGKKPGQKPSLQLMLPLPIGQDSLGVVIPVADAETGRKTMSFTIGVARRIDDDHVKMTDLVIETFAEGAAGGKGEDGKEEKEMTIDLPDSMLDMKTGIITGKERVTIKRSDFQITGRTMEFDTNTKQGEIKGDVKMIIYDLNLEAPSPSPSSSPEPPKAGG